MGFLKKVGAAVGVGAAKVEVNLPGGAFHWNQTVQGSFTLTGGTVDQTAPEIKVSILEHWESQDSEGDRDDHYRAYNERVVARDVNIPAGSVQEFPFEVAIPDDQIFGHDWYVVVRASLPRASDSTGQRKFDMLPPVAIMRAVEAVQAVAPFKVKFYENHQRTVHADFAPPQDRKNDLDGVRLMVHEDLNQVSGEFEINPQEHSIADRLKALMKKDRVRHPVTFSRQALLDAPEGEPPAEVVEQLRALLQPYLG